MPAILFDLDGTLLDIELGPFLRAYFSAIGVATAEHFPDVDVAGAIIASTEAMQRRHPGITNRQAFNIDFSVRTGIDLTLPENIAVFDDFYERVFPKLGEGYGPAKGARRAVEKALELGMTIVVATQPIFPRTAIRHRLAWAGLDDVGLELLTTYEVMHACKPSPEYFREAAAMAGFEPSECLMVGDDRSLDMPAADVGMRTFFVGADRGSADWSGDLDDVAKLLPRLAGAKD